MSKELLDLVQRSQRFKPATKKPPKPTVELTALLKRMRTRRWKQETEAELKGFIEQTKSEMAFIRHVGKCGNCLFELQMNIERYWGRGCPWFLDVHDEIGLPDEFLEFDDEYNPHLKGMPLVRDYQIGSYWTGPSDDTIRFIKDRLSWAEKKLKKDLGFAAKALTILEGWDFNLHTPQQEIDSIIEAINELESRISPLFFFWGEPMPEKQPNVKEFPGKPSVFVASQGSIIEVTTSEHLKNANKPLEQILKEVCEEARQYANKIYQDYDYPNGKWYPCGSADIVLRWNKHRNIIKLFQKTATEKKTDYWTGWFGKLHKTQTQGWWWMPKLDQYSQSMLYEEEVCRFVRQKLTFANIVVEIRTYID